MNEAHNKRVVGGKQFSEVPAGHVEPAEEPVASTYKVLERDVAVQLLVKRDCEVAALSSSKGLEGDGEGGTSAGC